MKFAAAALLGLASAVSLDKKNMHFMPIQTDEGFVMMTVESVQKL